jgi:hypothetical protein
MYKKMHERHIDDHDCTSEEESKDDEKHESNSSLDSFKQEFYDQ